MTEAEWLASEEPEPMLAAAQEISERKALLIGCGCCRTCASEIVLDEFHRATELLERAADGLATDEEYFDAHRIANYALDLCTGTAPWIPSRYKTSNSLAGAWAVRELAARNWDCVPRENSWDRYSRPKQTPTILVAVTRAIANLECVGSTPGTDVMHQPRAVRGIVRVIHDIVGNPFRPVAFSPEWRTDTTIALARAMYESREFSAMPILADALQDAGCDNDEVLNHCREPGTHVRGCWVVDLVLGKS